MLIGRFLYRDTGCASGSSRSLLSISSVIQIPSLVSSIMTLRPGGLVITAAPSGIGPLYEGDTVEVEIEGIGRLLKPVHQGRK